MCIFKDVGLCTNELSRETFDSMTSLQNYRLEHREIKKKEYTYD